MNLFQVACMSIALLLSSTRLVLAQPDDNKDHKLVPYTLHFHHSDTEVEEMSSRHLGAIDQLRQLSRVRLAFDYKNVHIICSMDKQTTVYTDLALERMNITKAPVTYESEDCVLTFLNESSFDGIALFHGTTLHFQRRDYEDLELDTSEGGELCLDRNPNATAARRQLRGKDVQAQHGHEHAQISELPRKLDAKPELWSDCYPGVSKGYKLKVGIAVGKRFQSTYGESAMAQVQSMVSAMNFAYKNQMNIEIVVDHLHTAAGPFNEDCYNGIDPQLDAFNKWKKPSTQGLWHLIDDCLGLSGERYSGTAYRQVICKAVNTGITYCNGRRCSGGYKTLAHELGHNFGAGHTFEEGSGLTGGIMDYGTGILNGIFQFNTKYRKDQLCKALRTVIPTCIKFKSNNGNGGAGDEAAQTSSPTPFPTQTSAPVPSPTQFPTKTSAPVVYPTRFPTKTSAPVPYPTRFPTQTKAPVSYPTRFPTQTKAPVSYPTRFPTRLPTQYPTQFPQPIPTPFPSQFPERRRVLNEAW